MKPRNPPKSKGLVAAQQRNTLRYSALRWLPSVFVALLIAACSGDPGTGPIEVKWDRDVCKRCNMVLSDRQHSAQIRHKPAGGRSQVYEFDDIGCAVLWLDQQPWSQDPEVEIWVSDHRSGEWLDARSAFYLTGQLTPMQYGLGAQSEATTETLNFAQAKQHIQQVEQRFNIHGGNLEHPEVTPQAPSIADPPSARSAADHTVRD